MDFSDRLKTLRQKRGMTQEQLANALDIPETSIRRWEAVGKPPKRERLEKLADYFGVSVDYLLGRESTPNKASDDDFNPEEHEFIQKLREIANKKGVELTDPGFLEIVEAAFDFAQRISKDQSNK